MINKFLEIAQNPDANAAGIMVTCATALNSFFQVFNPVLTGIFYIASIAWLLVQIYYKISRKGK
jgi:hypothetical protein